MKIALVMTHLANGGGAYQLIFLARELVKRGHEVSIVTYYQPEVAFSNEWLTGLTIHHSGKHLPESTIDSQLVGLLKHVRELFTVTVGMVRTLRALKPDVVQPHEWPAHWAAAIYSKWNKVPVVWMCNDVWHVPGYAERPEKRVLFRWVHRLLLVPLDLWLTAQVKMITVLDNRIKGITQSHYKRTPVRVVRSGIDIAQYPEKKLCPHASWIWLCFSIFHPHRRFEDVIRAFGQLKKTSKIPMKLVIAGSHAHAPGYAATLLQLTQALGLEQDISFDNRYVTHQEKLDYLQSCDSFIFPNEMQTWGLVVIEAMALGKPCIVSTGAGVHEIIEDGETGLIYPVGNVGALVVAMKKVLHEHTIMGKKAQKMVREHYSWENYAQSMEAICENCHI